jgi:hypothetical protein
MVFASRRGVPEDHRTSRRGEMMVAGRHAGMIDPARAHFGLVARAAGCVASLLLFAAPLPSAQPEDLHPPRAIQPAGPPAWLPRYDVDMKLDLAGHMVYVHQRVTWTNTQKRRANQIVFNAHSHYRVPEKDIGFSAKMLEILRMTPSEVLDSGDGSLQIEKVACDGTELPIHYEGDTDTTLVVDLPKGVVVQEGQAITLDFDFTFRLPQKQGRWGQWEGVTQLSNWLPVVAVYDETGWQPTPFIAWHQPFFNEAGVYTVRAVLPCGQKIACTGTIVGQKDMGNGQQEVLISANGVRDFAFLCSDRYVDYSGQAGPVRVHVIAFPEHEHYAKAILDTVCEVIPVYSRWFGPYPYPDFTVAESFFGWNGNECATLVMIDSRVFGMPHVGGGYVEYLLSHETCHQWWYNLVGTNGYCETWVDEAHATYFAHRFQDQKHGKNNNLLHYPAGLEWMPNISRDTYRNYSLYGCIGRGEATVTVQEMPKYRHLVNLFCMNYDKGSRIVGMIEDRLGPEAYLDFMRLIYHRYQYRILRVKDFQRELESYTGKSWEEFFQRWLYGAGFTDWAVEKVNVEDALQPGTKPRGPSSEAEDAEEPSHCWLCTKHKRHPCKVTIFLHQKAECNEDTIVGICLDDGKCHAKCNREGCPYQVRIPIVPRAGVVELEDPPTRIEPTPDNRVVVQVVLPCRPTQVTVDPDQILPDADPSNNYWKPPKRWRFTPLYTFLEETDLTNAYDRWNVLYGPWIFGAPYDDPWYTRSTMIGARAGLYRTQVFNGGVYAAYRTDFRDVVAGIDGMWDHWPWHRTQIGFNAEHRLTTFYHGDNNVSRGSVYGRYVFEYGDSLYLPPMHYLETFGAFQQNFLPKPRNTIPGAERYDETEAVGLHYHLDLLTPYWDPEGGARIDATYSAGLADLRTDQGLHQFTFQASCVKFTPDLSGHLNEESPLGQVLCPPLRWLADTKWAFRVYGAVGLPIQAEYFPLGGSELLRGFDLAERQGSLAWVGSVEWRVPLAKHLVWDAIDHSVGLRNLYAAAFYDVGDAYLRNRSLGPVAHSVGVGLRMDVAWFSFIERTTLRFDVAKTVNADTPVQFWFGIKHPF